jgi:ribosome maturation factor RimP
VGASPLLFVLGPVVRISRVAAQDFDRYALADQLYELLAGDLAAEDLELIDVRIFRGGGRLQVRLYVDAPGDDRVDLEGCLRASRTAGLLLEAADPIPGPYVLEVSSPGVRRPLRTEAHFAAAVGRPVELRVRGGEGRPRRLRGRLESAYAGTLRVSPLAAGGEDGAAPVAEEGGERRYGEPVDLRRADVLEANLDEDLDVQALINAERRDRKEEKKKLREERKTQPRGRQRPKPHRET